MVARAVPTYVLVKKGGMFNCPGQENCYKLKEFENVKSKVQTTQGPAVKAILTIVELNGLCLFSV